MIMHAVLFLVIVLTCSIPMAAAHTTVSVESYEIEVGWDVEPPVKGLRNDFVINVVELGDVKGVTIGVKNAFKNMSAMAIYGGEKKLLDIGSQSRPGHYFAPVIPTKTGSYSVEFFGNLNGIDVQINVPIEDVENTAVLDFPTSKVGSDQDVATLKSAMSDLQQQVRKMISNVQEDSDASVAYDLAVFGISFGIAGTILAIIAMIRKNRL
ncbi:MAG: putative exported protein [Cenarchaeum symbiont of Oopsacas minuta]|nr:putative exported protein [Cenarchaeum symbiont of Oopsacas minuta]